MFLYASILEGREKNKNSFRDQKILSFEIIAFSNSAKKTKTKTKSSQVLDYSFVYFFLIK